MGTMMIQDQLWEQLDATLKKLRPDFGLFAETDVGNVRVWQAPTYATNHAGKLVVDVESCGRFAFHGARPISSLTSEEAAALLRATWYCEPQWRSRKS